MIPSIAGLAILLRTSSSAHADAGLAIVAAAGEPDPGSAAATTTPTGQPFGAAQPVLRLNVSAAAEGDILAYWSPDGGASWFEAITLGSEVT